MDSVAQVLSVEVAEMTAADLDRAENVIRRGLNTFVEVGNALQEIRDGRGYRLAGFGTFEDYCQTKWSLTRQHVNRMIGAYEVVRTLEPMGSILPATERQARPLSALEPSQQVTAWNYAVETAQRENGGKVTAAIVQRAADDVKNGAPYRHVSDDSYEWYTPTEYIEAARRVMGAIDLDPASSDEAQKIVKAKKYYTKDDDGLTQSWRGRAFINPPYCMPEVERFCDRAIAANAAGDVPQVVVLINNATDAAYFHRLIDAAGAVCFTRGRVKYWGPNSAAARQGQAIFYIGDQTAKFAAEFSEFGAVMVKYDHS